MKLSPRATGASCRTGLPWASGPRAAIGLALAFLLCAASANAEAAALGRLVTSVGLLSTLGALVIAKGWADYWPAAAVLPAGICALGAGAGAAWWWRSNPPGWAGGRVFPRAKTAALARTAQPVRAGEVVLPAGLRREDLILVLKSRFMAMQLAWDQGDVSALQALATPEMLEELMQERGHCAAACAVATDRTDVLTLNAALIGFDATAQALVVSVEFTGLMRESPERGAMPFRELWMLVQSPQEKEGWRLARHHALL